VDDGIATRLMLGNGHHADTTFHRFAMNNKSDYLTRSRHLPLVNIHAGFVLSAVAANMTNVVVLAFPQKP
jgi:hypothetical protein